MVKSAAIFIACSAAAHASVPTYQIQTVGLVGGEYRYGTSSSFKQYSTVEQVNAAGQIVGTSQTFSNTGSIASLDSFYFANGASVRINLVGSAYQWVSNGVPIRKSFVTILNESGQAVGTSTRYSSIGNGIERGKDVFYANRGTSQAIGLFGGGYEYNTAGGIVRQSAVASLSESGHAAGTTNRYTANGTSLGTDTWRSINGSTSLVGLFGGEYESTSANGVQRVSAISGSTAQGVVFGYTGRQTAAGSGRGRDAWRSDESGTVRIGLIGIGYEYDNGGTVHRISTVTSVSPAGNALGTSSLYSPSGENLGNDAWLYAVGNVTRVGLEGPAYTYIAEGNEHRGTSATFVNDDLYVVGSSNRWSNSGTGLGSDVWLRRPDGATMAIGLTGGIYDAMTTAGIRRNSVAIALNAGGVAVGSQQRLVSTIFDSISSFGNDIWIHQGGQTRVINPVGGAYEQSRTDNSTGAAGIDRRAEMRKCTDSNIVIGFAERYANGTPGSGGGQDAWVYRDGVTTPLFLSGAAYGYNASNGLERYSDVIDVNEAGDVIGYTRRYNGNVADRQTAWFYDSAAAMMYPLYFSGSPVSEATYLSETGVVVGRYLPVGQNGLNDGYHIFWWRKDLGVRDLGILIEGGLTNSGWALLATNPFLTDFADGRVPDYIVGHGLLTGQTAGQTAFIARLVPEPTSCLLFGVASLLPRKRR